MDRSTSRPDSLTLRKEPGRPFYRRLGGPHRGSGRFGREKSSRPYRDSNCGPSNRSLITVPTELAKNIKANRLLTLFLLTILHFVSPFVYLSLIFFSSSPFSCFYCNFLQDLFASTKGEDHLEELDDDGIIIIIIIKRIVNVQGVRVWTGSWKSGGPL